MKTTDKSGAPEEGKRDVIESAASFTPGPWKYDKVTYLFAGTSSEGPTFEISDHGLSQHWIAHALTESNARLIAAAPDLLEALKRARIRMLRYGEIESEIADIEQALAKAEGQ